MKTSVTFEIDDSAVTENGFTCYDAYPPESDGNTLTLTGMDPLCHKTTVILQWPLDNIKLSPSSPLLSFIVPLQLDHVEDGVHPNIYSPPEHNSIIQI